MAEETNEETAEQDSGEKKGGLLGKLIPVVAVLLFLIGGAAVYLVVIAPRLSVDDAAEVGEVVEENPGDELPLMAAMVVTLDSKYVNLMREGDGGGSMLIYGVKLECNDQGTMDLVIANQHRFEDMIMKLHDSRTRSELDDILQFKESVQRQALQKSNDILKRLQGEEPDENVKITAVLHYQLAVQDQF